jgi:hypothetical protein
MSYDFVGLENLPNVYIKKISLFNKNQNTFKVDVSLMMIDEVFENTFVWSDDPLLYDYLKVAVIATSNPQLISGITEGLINPHPNMIKENPILMDGTEIAITSPKQAIRTQDVNTRRYTKSVSFLAPVDTSTMTLFAFTYIDTQELSNALRIALTGPLSHYYGSVTSEHVLVGGEVQESTFLFRETASGKTWSGPVHQMQTGRWMGGSYHSSEPYPLLTRVPVRNKKIVDYRALNARALQETQAPQKPIFSTLSESFTDEADFIGMFSIDMRSLILQKTKYGRKMFNVSPKLFETFSKSIVINSLEVRRQQIKLRASLNKLGTRKYRDNLIGSYKTISATIERGNALVNTRGLSQAYITTDPLVKTYQFIDEEMSERTRGEFRYEAVVTFMDKSQDFLENMILQMEKNISDMKVQQEFLFRPQRYDRQNNNLRPGVTVPDIFRLSVENYYNNLSFITVITDEERDKLIKNKQGLFSRDNYVDKQALDFIKDYSALASKLRRRFDIKEKIGKTIGGKKPSRSTAPSLISMNHIFENIIKFDNVVASYDLLGVKSNKALVSFTKDEYLKRADLEVSRFFDTTRSSTSDDLADLDKEDMVAIKDVDSAKFGFLAPLSFKFKTKSTDLKSLQNLDLNGLSQYFISHMNEKQADPRFSSAPVRKEKQAAKTKPKSNPRLPIKKRRFGRAKFNFRKPPIKINNLKTEEYLDVSKYLGSNSEMVNIEPRLDRSIPAQDTEQVETKVAITQGLSAKREKKAFDLREKNNIFEKFKSSPKFDRKKLKMMPLPIKALLNSRSNAAKNNILEADSDILKDAETKVATEMMFHASQKIEYFVGFEMDMNGLPNVSQPKWEEVTPAALESNSRLLCRMRYAEIPELEIQPAKEFKLLAQNSTFFISDEAISSIMTAEVVVPEEDLTITPELEEVDDIVFASSNYVKQNQARRQQLIEPSGGQ